MGEFIVVFSLVSLLNSPCESKEKSTMYGKHLQCRHACAYEEVGTRVLPRLFDQVVHQTTNSFIGNKHFFIK